LLVHAIAHGFGWEISEAERYARVMNMPTKAGAVATNPGLMPVDWSESIGLGRVIDRPEGQSNGWIGRGVRSIKAVAARGRCSETT
jgi:hypothetical protein